MAQFLSLLKVELKTNHSEKTSVTTYSRRIYSVSKTVVTALAIILLISMISKLIIDWSVANSLQIEFLIFAILLGLLVTFLFSVSGIIKALQAGAES